MSREWLLALGGGGLIGLAAAMLWLVNGRTAGISGIVGGSIAPRSGDVAWRLWFVAGLLLGGLFVYVIPSHFDQSAMPSSAVVIAAGLLVGFGTRLGSGCTSGHGICGLGRGSPRSVTATAVFMLFAGLTVFATRHMP